MPAIHLAQALAILSNAWPTRGSRPSRSLPVEQALGQVAAEAVAASVDHPPTDQSLRDGVAYAAAPTPEMLTRWATLPLAAEPENIRELQGDVFPGDSTPPPLLPGQAVRIMTGAAVPDGACGVAMIEDVEWLNTSQAPDLSAHADSKWTTAQAASHVRLPAVRPRTHVLARASIYARGDELIPLGSRLEPISLGLLASTGRDSIRCFVPPRVAVLTTGDELVNAGQAIKPGHVYNSNGPLLRALLGQAGVTDLTVEHVGDQEEQIAAWLERKLGAVDLILTTGAVSAGQKDQLPALFQRLGVQTLFHGVHIKPGKPVFCGRFETSSNAAENASAEPTMVLGLPGNPISVWVTFHLFGWPLLEMFHGRRYQPRWLRARLSKTGNYQDSRLTFWPGQLQWGPAPWEPSIGKIVNDTVNGRVADVSENFSTSGNDTLSVRPLEWQGSADLRSPTAANCLIYFPTDAPPPTRESLVDVLLLPSV